ncbi:MAG: polysaccharide deacetylase family protein [Candidatus Promineifilaceae bacterium]
MSSPNPILIKLGLSDNDRVVIFHADDIGNFQGSLDAYRDLVDVGLLSSASTMVPCPWFPATAEFCRTHAGHPNLDMGVHLTLTSEWDAYRWGPVTTSDPATGLVDDEGYFHRTSAAVQQQADLQALRAELRAQIERARTAGIDITHIDSHMFTLIHPRLVDTYIDLALEFHVPPFLLRDRESAAFEYFSPAVADQLLDCVPAWEEQGLPLLDDAAVLPLNNAQDRAGQLLAKLNSLKPGITYLVVHPTKDTPGLREAVSDQDWPCRVADYEIFLDTAVRDAVRETGVHVIGWRALRELMPGRGGA